VLRARLYDGYTGMTVMTKKELQNRTRLCSVMGSFLTSMRADKPALMLLNVVSRTKIFRRGRLSGQSDKHELMLLKQHTDKGLDPKTELSVVLHVKNNSGLYSRSRARAHSLRSISSLTLCLPLYFLSNTHTHTHTQNLSNLETSIFFRLSFLSLSLRF
jgi:hypothetical protein